MHLQKEEKKLPLLRNSITKDKNVVRDLRSSSLISATQKFQNIVIQFHNYHHWRRAIDRPDY